VYRKRWSSLSHPTKWLRDIHIAPVDVHWSVSPYLILHASLGLSHEYVACLLLALKVLPSRLRRTFTWWHCKLQYALLGLGGRMSGGGILQINFLSTRRDLKSPWGKGPCIQQPPIPISITDPTNLKTKMKICCDLYQSNRQYRIHNHYWRFAPTQQEPLYLTMETDSVRNVVHRIRLAMCKAGLLNFLCGADKFGRIWYAYRKHEVPHTERRMNKCTYNCNSPVCLYIHHVQQKYTHNNMKNLSKNTNHN
jgi:hypothetical protein